ncbi:GGDEF domain-containing protein [Marinobacter caseinilyticus]|uniref:GGDEF domain-containing protein n=1 Tax=Marinobacter caseinilyticus TaxID=2692195 RepID=UPI00140AF724|nr:GGDEF domain-containing protein [Marinobacter caseinilyticus]
MAQMADKFLLSRFARLGCLLLLGLAAYAAVISSWLSVSAALTGAALIWTTPANNPDHARPVWVNISRVMAVALTGFLITSLWTGPVSLTHWLYVVPLVAFALFPIAWAAMLIVACMVAVMVTALMPEAGPGRHQLVSSLLLTIALTGLLVFLREYKTRQLAPLRRTDELTQAASRDYLSADLHKEIQRSEREGTDMAIIMVGLDTHLSDSDPDADIKAILPRIGRFLHSQLRDFDSYYRVADLQFLIILPGNTTAESAAKAEQIRKGLKALLVSHELDLTVSAGIAGLNIGDDADSLQQSAANALRRAQQQGGNRVQSYSAWSDRSGTKTGEPRLD